MTGKGLEEDWKTKKNRSERVWQVEKKWCGSKSVTVREYRYQNVPEGPT